jgi:Leucine-rich repeat (LRR) protein
VVCELLNLEELYLNNNQLSSLHPSIVRLVNLKRLQSGPQSFQSIPMFVGRLPQLKELFVGGELCL